MALRQIITGSIRSAPPGAADAKINDPVLSLLQDDRNHTMPPGGAAAPRIGISRRLVVIDPGEQLLRNNKEKRKSSTKKVRLQG